MFKITQCFSKNVCYLDKNSNFYGIKIKQKVKNFVEKFFVQKGRNYVLCFIYDT